MIEASAHSVRYGVSVGSELSQCVEVANIDLSEQIVFAGEITTVASTEDLNAAPVQWHLGRGQVCQHDQRNKPVRHVLEDVSRT